MPSPILVRRQAPGRAGVAALGAAILFLASMGASRLPVDYPGPVRAGFPPPPVVIEKGDFRFACDERGVSALANPHDPFKATLMPDEGTRGARPPVLASRRLSDGQEGGMDRDRFSRPRWTASPEAGTASYASGGPGAPVKIVETYRTDGSVLDWTIDLEATGEAPVEVGDLGIGIPAAGPYGENPAQIFERGFLRHQFVSGAGSFLYFVRASGAPPFLLVTGSPGTKLEYFDGRGGPAAVSSCIPAGAAPRRRAAPGARPTRRSISRPPDGRAAGRPTASGCSGRRAMTSCATCSTTRASSTSASFPA